MIMALYYDIIINKLKNFIILLQFIEIVIYFSKLIDFCINRQENPKVVNNYFVGTNDVSVQTNKTDRYKNQSENKSG